jgi:membrane protein implicated in regulation of membrane protease activity
MFLLLALLLLIFLPSPWNLIAGLSCGALGVGEVLYWQRRMRRRKIVTGVENLVGATGEVTEPCAPLGQVRLQGELWEARSASELRRGTPVRVVAVQGLTLEVEPMNDALGSNVMRAGSLVVALVVALALAGCGGGDEDPAEDWASNVCSDLSTWITQVDDAVKSLTDAGLSIDEADVESALADVQNATNELGADLADLGPPETEGGEQAESELESLAAKLETQVETVQEAVESDGQGLSVATTVTSSISTATKEVQTTYENLQGVDPGGELQDGFENADSCDSFREQLEDIGS